MNENLINKYVTINNINLLAKKEGIILEEYESNYIYKIIKENWYSICYENAFDIFDKLKSNVREETYNLIINLYNKYKGYLKLL